MNRFVWERLLAVIPVLFVVSLVTFMLQEIAPGDPARLILEASGLDPVLPAALEKKRAELGLDRSWPERYRYWLLRAIKGDFGRSFRTYESVTSTYLDRLPATAILALTSVALATLIAVPLGLCSAYSRGGAIDGVAQVVATAGTAIPGFWLAFMLMWLFGARLNWLPVFGSVSPRGIILPATVLALPTLSILTRTIRSSALDVISSDFTTVARAKGLTESTIALRHLFPNALLPALTILGMEVGGLFAGAAVVEYVFAWPGIGKLAIDSALLRDSPVVVGFAIASALGVILANLIVDIVAGTIDPRVRQ
jgi:peptide/nickel transport system permease protein